MRNIFIFLWRHNFVLYFLVLEVVCFIFLINHNQYQKASVISSSNNVSGRIYESVNYVKDYISLKQSNEQLVRENVALKNLLRKRELVLLDQDSLIKDTLHKQQYSFMYAKVINNSITKQNNFLTLNKGSLHGVKPEMGVVSSNGVVGIVKDVSQNYSTVISLLNEKSKVSVKIKSSNHFGTMAWPGSDSRIGLVTLIPKHVKIKEGDTLTTTSYSTIFPEGIMAGTVVSYDVKPGDNFYSISIRYSTSFSNLDFVYLVKDLKKEERIELENNLIQQ